MATDPEYDGDEPELDVPVFVSGLFVGGYFADGEIPDDTGDPGLEWSPSRMLDVVEDSPAGPTSMTILEGLPVRMLDSYDRVRLMREWDRQTSHCEAMKLAAMKAVVDDAEDRAFVSHEIAAALHVTRPVADHLVNVCRRLARTLPVTARALADGRVTEAQAIVISDETGPLTRELAGQVEDRLIPNAETQTVGQFRAAVRKLVAALDPEGFAERHQRQRSQNDVAVTDYGDGISGLFAMMTTPDAAIVKTAVDAWADHRLSRFRCAGAKRCAEGRRRACEPLGPSGLLHAMHLPLIDLPTLLGLADHPGEIPGYGIIPAGLARTLAADGTWRRLITDPQTGHLIDCGRTRYRPSQHLTDYLLARDRVSCFPGSTVPSTRCDIDHHTPYPDGPTNTDNTGPFDRRAHRAKTHAHYTAHRTKDGTTRWDHPHRTHLQNPTPRLPTRPLVLPRRRGARQSHRTPGAIPAVEVGGTVNSQLLQRCGRQARGIPLVTYQNDPGVVRRDVEPRIRGRVEPPLQHVAVDDERAGDLALGTPVDLRADVDEQRTTARGVERLLRGEPGDAAPCLDQHGVDRRSGHGVGSGVSVGTVRNACSPDGRAS
jgi:Domain of unknown function (DUF222)